MLQTRPSTSLRATMALLAWPASTTEKRCWCPERLTEILSSPPNQVRQSLLSQSSQSSSCSLLKVEFLLSPTIGVSVVRLARQVSSVRSITSSPSVPPASDQMVSQCEGLLLLIMTASLPPSSVQVQSSVSTECLSSPERRHWPHTK